MAAPIFDYDRAGRILVDAVLLGEQTACDKWQISRKTLSRYRERLADDPKLSAVVQQKKRLIDDGWQREASDLLKKTLTKLGQLVDNATQEQIREVVGVAKVVGDLVITQTAIGSDESESEPESDGIESSGNRSGQAPEEAPSADPLEEEDEEDSVEDA